MQDRNDRIITDLMEQLIASGPDGMASAFTTLLNLAMRLEREQHLGARAYERTPERGGYANGYKPKRLDTAARDVEKVMAEFGLDSLSSTQVSRAAATLDEELEAWRTRPLGQVRYLFLDARYEKMRVGGVVRDAALFSAIGVDGEGRRSVLGVSVALSPRADNGDP